MDSLLTKAELLSAVKGIALGDADCVFYTVATDSRNVKSGAKCMFVPLIGEVQNGHKYIPTALENKASVILLNASEYEENSKYYDELVLNNRKTLFVCVKNTLHALQDAAEAYVSKKCADMIKVSITGSSGKTTTKEMLTAIAKAYYGEENVAYTKGNFNSETGLPLSVFTIKGSEKIGIFEMGMNRVNEIGEISKVLKSKYGIITNIGTAHIGILGSRQNIAEEKRKSLIYIPEDGVAFVPAADDFADYCGEVVKGKVVKFGASVESLTSGINYIRDNGVNGHTISVDEVEIKLPLPGFYNYQNACGVIACCRALGIPASKIKEGLENINILNGRMNASEIELKNNKKITLISDCYNANPDSMDGSIEFCRKLDKNVIYVLGDMKELGDFSKKEHKKIGDKLISVNPYKIVLVGPEMKAAQKVIDKSVYKDRLFYFENNEQKTMEDISKIILESCQDGEVILLKASHSIALERIENLIKKDMGR